MQARRYVVSVRGVTPLLLHGDNLQWADYLERWKTDPVNARRSVPGDDRTPAWRWLGFLYTDGGRLVVPADNLMTVLREGAKRCPAKRGKGTLKAQSQSGIVINEAAWPLLVRGRTIDAGPVLALQQEDSFEAHERAVQTFGFSLFVKRARVNQTKHVRVRPRFDEWALRGTVTVFDDAITTQVLRDILVFAGMYAGLGDWRPSAPKSPGPFGKFEVETLEQQ